MIDSNQPSDTPAMHKAFGVYAEDFVRFIESMGEIKCEVCGSLDFKTETDPERPDVSLLAATPILQIPSQRFLFFTMSCTRCANTKFFRADMVIRALEAQNSGS